jgi:hypothetical protein
MISAPNQNQFDPVLLSTLIPNEDPLYRLFTGKKTLKISLLPNKQIATKLYLDLHFLHSSPSSLSVSQQQCVLSLSNKPQLLCHLLIQPLKI